MVRILSELYSDTVPSIRKVDISSTTVKPSDSVPLKIIQHILRYANARYLLHRQVLST